MKNRNSGLGCGCSSGGDLGAVPMAPFLTPQSAAQTAKYTANPGMTVNPAATRQAIAPGATVSQAQLERMYFREGIAFGVAWTAGLERNATVAAQWHGDLERAAVSWETQGRLNGTVVASLLEQALRSASDRNRAAFVAGFELGIRIVLERRTSIRSPIGRTYTQDFLLAQGRVAANNLFSQARPAVLPAVTATSATPMTPGVVAARSTIDQLNSIAQAAIAANLASAAPYALEPTRVDQYNPGWRGVEWPFNVFQTDIPPDMARGLFPFWGGPATQAVLLLMGNRGNVSSTDRTRISYISPSIRPQSLAAVRNWALTAIATAPSAPAGRAAIFLPYLRAIVAAIPEQNPVRVAPR